MSHTPKIFNNQNTEVCSSCNSILDKNMWSFPCGHAFQRCCIFKFLEGSYAACPECVDPKTIMNTLYIPKSMFRRTIITPV